MIKKFMKKNILLLAVFIVMLVIIGCSNNSATEAGFTVISSEEAKQRLDNDEKIIVLDVRTKEEYESGHIPHAILIPVNNLQEQAEHILIDKGKPIFVYCRSGNRSAVASNILVKLGYSQVYNLGGINDWPYELVK